VFVINFNPDIERGQIVKNDDLRRIFGCSPQGGMRRSKKTNSLVIVSDHTTSIYDDRWEEDIFHYTGMGLHGDQNLNYAQNKTLSESNSNNVNLFLFEVFDNGKYIFQGRIELVKRPYQEKQEDISGNIRTVWIFPLKLLEGERPLIQESILKKKQNIREKTARKLTIEELEKRIKTSSKKIGYRTVIASQYERNEYVAEFVRRRANGICCLCQNGAPFKDKRGNPFLEIHHIEWLSEDGEDTISNTVALCPNCHRKMHIVNSENDKILLRRSTKY
jgi:5-methylcytosine-specific restriction protein A